MKIEELAIRNFRCIKDLSLKGLQDINVFVGDNNAGKTSLLEAIFLATGISSPNLTLNIEYFRNFPRESSEDFKYIFNDLNLENSIEIKVKFEEFSRKLLIEPKYQESKIISDKNKKEFSVNPQDESEEYGDIIGLNYEFEISGSRYNTSIKFDREKGYKIDILKDYKEEIFGAFISPVSFSIVDLVRKISNIIKKKRSKEFIKLLKLFDNRISGVATENSVLVDIGLDEYVPYQILGRGFATYLSIVSSFFEDKINSNLVIDDIETGLHYSALNTLWKSIIKLSKEKNIQLFASTQSLENINALYNQVKNDNSIGVKVYRLERINGEIEVVDYSYEDLKNSLESNFEIR